MEETIKRFSSDLNELLEKLNSRKKDYLVAMQKDKMLAEIKKILRDIRELEKSIVALVEENQSLQNDKSN